jgi:hypothetical protein
MQLKITIRIWLAAMRHYRRRACLMADRDITLLKHQHHHKRFMAGNIITFSKAPSSS